MKSEGVTLGSGLTPVAGAELGNAQVTKPQREDGWSNKGLMFIVP